MDKKIRLPREGFIDDKDIEGPGVKLTDPTDEDVEGHASDLTVLPAPPNLGHNRSPGHGGEVRDPGEDTH